MGGIYSYKATLTSDFYQMALLNIETSRIYPVGLRAFLKIVFFYDLYLPTIPRSEPVGLKEKPLRKNDFGQIFRFNSLDRATIRLIRSKNLTQNDIPSLRLTKSEGFLV
jgi:hypothetical protein